MECKKKVLGLVVARGGSKGIPNKNIKLFCGKPLIKYTIDVAIASETLDRIILSTDDKKIADYVRKVGIEVPFMRPKELAEDSTPALPVIDHAVKELYKLDGYAPDYIALLQPTSPLRTKKHLDEAINILINSDADSIVSVVKVPHNFNPYSIMEVDGNYVKPFLNWNEENNLRSLKPTFWARNGAAIYAFTKDCLLKKNSIYGDKILAYPMDKKYSIDIDDMFDWEVAEFLLKKDN